MSVEKVREYFEPFGLAGKILEPEASSAIELTLPELEEYSHAAKWIDVGKDWE